MVKNRDWVQTMLRGERTEGVCIPPLVTFCGTVIANEVNKKFQVNLLGTIRQFEGQLLPCPFYSYVPVKS